MYIYLYESNSYKSNRFKSKSQLIFVWTREYEDESQKCYKKFSLKLFWSEKHSCTNLIYSKT